ncbi:MAG: sugar ABC transporter permease [Solirubrobacterales bacterium]|nr:sugar ABC transporter permease [Solirubrobacterales bacterium]
MPFLVLFLGMYLAPICVAVYKSLFVMHSQGLGLSGGPSTVFKPLANYTRALGDSAFIGAILRVLLFGVVQVPVMLGLATLFALVIDAVSARVRAAFRFAAFLPYVVPGVVAAMIWSLLYSPNPNASSPFFSNGLTLWSVANVVTWTWTGYNMLIIYSALTAIPSEIIEAARVDGASGWRIAWHVKLPMVRSSLILTTVFSIIGTAQLYNEPSILQAVSGGAISSTYTPVMAANNAIHVPDFQYAAALSVILALVVGALSLGFFKLVNRRGPAWG